MPSAPTYDNDLQFSRIGGPMFKINSSDLHGYYATTVYEKLKKAGGVFAPSIEDLGKKLLEWQKTIDPNDSRPYFLPVVIGGLHTSSIMKQHTSFAVVTYQNGKFHLHSLDSFGIIKDGDKAYLDSANSVFHTVSHSGQKCQENSDIGCREYCLAMTKIVNEDQHYLTQRHLEAERQLRLGEKKLSVKNLPVGATYLIGITYTLSGHVRYYYNDPKAMEVIRGQLQRQMQSGHLKKMSWEYNKFGKEADIKYPIPPNMSVDDVIKEIYKGGRYANVGWKRRAAQNLGEHYTWRLPIWLGGKIRDQISDLWPQKNNKKNKMGASPVADNVEENRKISPSTRYREENAKTRSQPRLSQMPAADSSHHTQDLSQNHLKTNNPKGQPSSLQDINVYRQEHLNQSSGNFYRERSESDEPPSSGRVSAQSFR